MHQIACHLPLSFSFIYGTNSCYNLLNDNMRHLNWSAAPASPIYGRNIRFNSNSEGIDFSDDDYEDD